MPWAWAILLFISDTCFCYLLISVKVSCLINAITVTVKGRHWRWLIYTLHNFLLHHNMLRVFRSNHHCSWKFHKFQMKTTVLESFSLKWWNYIKTFVLHAAIFFLMNWRHKRLKNTIDLLLFYGEHLYGFLESDLWKCWKKNIHFTKNISIYESQTIWQFYDVLFCTYCKRFVLSLKHSQHK